MSKGLDEETGLPTISLDYETIGDEITIWLAKDKESGAAVAYDYKNKVPSDKLGSEADMVLKTDGDPAMVALQMAIAEARPKF